MSKVFIIHGGSLESYYEQTMAYLHAQYHTYPSGLLDLPSSAEQTGPMGNSEMLARNIVDQAEIDNSIPLGKLVI